MSTFSVAQSVKAQANNLWIVGSNLTLVLPILLSGRILYIVLWGNFTDFKEDGKVRQTNFDWDFEFKVAYSSQ